MPFRLPTTTNVPTTTGPDWTNIGPLTSIFTPPPRCSNNGDLGDEGRPFAYIPNRWPSLVFVNSNNVECYPATAPTLTTTFTGTRTGTSTATFVDFQHKYFSPGICPSGWYSAADYGSRYAGSPGLMTEEGEKIAVCCPTGYTPTFVSLTTPDPRRSTGSCLSVLTSPVTAVACATCNNTENGLIVEPSVTATDPANPSGKDASIVPVTAVETTILVRWKATDEPLLDSIRAENENHGLQCLTTGQKAGIVIGVALATLLLLGVLAGFAWFLKKKRSARSQAPPVNPAIQREVDSESAVAYKLEDSDDDSLVGTGR